MQIENWIFDLHNYCIHTLVSDIYDTSGMIRNITENA